MNPRVLILGARAPVALDHARRFLRNGWQVDVADSVSCRLSGWSRDVRASHRIPSPRYDAAGFVSALNGIVARHRIDMLLPNCEEVFYLSRYRHLLPSQLDVIADHPDLLRDLHSKSHFLQRAQRSGMPTPPSASVTTLEQARDWSSGRGVVLKPEYSRFGVHVRLYPDGIPADAKPLEPLGKWVAQQFMPGTELCSYSIARDGRLLAHAVYRPTYRLRRSSSYYFDAVRRPALRDAVESLVKSINFSGQISFDWIESADGQLHALECNPRATSGLHLFSSHADLPAALCGEGELREPDIGAARVIAPILHSAGLLSALRQRGLRAWRQDARRAGDVITASGDVMPLPGALFDLGAYALLAMRRGCSLREAATRDIEWDGEELEPLA